MFTNTKDTKLLFISNRVYKKTEQSNPILFVELANPNTYDKFTFIADKDNVNVDQFGQGQPVNVELTASNYNGRTSMTLTAISPA